MKLFPNCSEYVETLKLTKSEEKMATAWLKRRGEVDYFGVEYGILEKVHFEPHEDLTPFVVTFIEEEHADTLRALVKYIKKQRKKKVLLEL